MSRSKNHSCSCAMCKPWKHGWDPKLKPSERRQIQEPIRAELVEMQNQYHYDREDRWEDEINEALYCHHYGPCPKCKGKS